MYSYKNCYGLSSYGFIEGHIHAGVFVQKLLWFIIASRRFKNDITGIRTKIVMVYPS